MLKSHWRTEFTYAIHLFVTYEQSTLLLLNNKIITEFVIKPLLIHKLKLFIYLDIPFKKLKMGIDNKVKAEEQSLMIKGLFLKFNLYSS